MKKSFIGKLYGNYNKNWKRSQEKGENMEIRARPS